MKKPFLVLCVMLASAPFAAGLSPASLAEEVAAGPCTGYFDVDCVHTGHWSTGLPSNHGDVHCVTFVDVPGDLGWPHNFHLGNPCLHGV